MCVGVCVCVCVCRCFLLPFGVVGGVETWLRVCLLVAGLQAMANPGDVAAVLEDGDVREFVAKLVAKLDGPEVDVERVKGAWLRRGGGWGGLRTAGVGGSYAAVGCFLAR